MKDKDIRWIQRYKHYRKALAQLQDAVELSSIRELSRLEEQGLIQAFEYSFELAWNTLKDYLEGQGETELHGSRDAIRLAFRRGLLQNGELWMDMLQDRIRTTHTYDENTAREVVQAVIQRYFPELIQLSNLLVSLQERYL